jgi:hypothetical protein
MRIKRIVIPALFLLILTLLVAAFQFEPVHAQAPAGTGVYIPAVRGEDGTLTAIRITAGVGGIMPPM